MKHILFFPCIIFLASTLFMACKKDNTGIVQKSYYLRKSSSVSNNVTHTTTTYDYDENKQLISEHKTGVDAAGIPFSYNSHYTYSSDGKVQFRLNENGLKQIEYSRDASGKVTQINFYLNDGVTINNIEQYVYFEDRYERSVVSAGSGHIIQLEKNYYTADKKNIDRSEYFDANNIKTSTLNFNYSDAKNPQKLVDGYFGLFCNEHICNVIYYDGVPQRYNITKNEGGYATGYAYDMGNGQSGGVNFELFQQ